MKGLDSCNLASPDILQNYKLHYIMHYVGFPTGSKNVERGVSLSNHCSLQKRWEAQRSLYASAGSESIKNSINRPEICIHQRNGELLHSRKER